ncbi:MAG: rRNA maturation RNase YbeY [Microcoleus sp.]
MLIEVNVEDCYGLAQQSADNSQEPQSAATREIAAETWETWFGVWLENQHEDVPAATGYEVSLRLTGDEEMQSLNSQYRHQDRSTDVLAFAALEVECPGSDEMSSEPLYLGDIVISIDTANRQAQQQGHPLKTELAWLAAHGFLHLLGWDHPDEESLIQMLDRQESLLQAIDIAIQTPLQEFEIG